jgi:uncharacterized protein (TIGR02444 family)
MTDDSPPVASDAGATLDDLPAWRFAFRIYAEPGVPESLIFLQDKFSLDVSLFLFLLHLSFSEGRAVNPHAVDDLRRFIAGWRAEVVAPLRRIRRAMKTSGGPFGHPASLAFRKQVAATELKAEQIEMALCYDWLSSQPTLHPILADTKDPIVTEILSVLLDEKEITFRAPNVADLIHVIDEAITRIITS